MDIYGKLSRNVLTSIIILKVSNLVDFISISLPATPFFKHSRVIFVYFKNHKASIFCAGSDRGYQRGWLLHFLDE